MAAKAAQPPEDQAKQQSEQEQKEERERKEQEAKQAKEKEEKDRLENQAREHQEHQDLLKLDMQKVEDMKKKAELEWKKFMEAVREEIYKYVPSVALHFPFLTSHDVSSHPKRQVTETMVYAPFSDDLG